LHIPSCFLGHGRSYHFTVMTLPWRGSFIYKTIVTDAYRISQLSDCHLFQSYEKESSRVKISAPESTTGEVAVILHTSHNHSASGGRRWGN